MCELGHRAPRRKRAVNSRGSAPDFGCALVRLALVWPCQELALCADVPKHMQGPARSVLRSAHRPPGLCTALQSPDLGLVAGGGQRGAGIPTRSPHQKTWLALKARRGPLGSDFKQNQIRRDNLRLCLEQGFFVWKHLHRGGWSYLLGAGEREVVFLGLI